MAINDEVLAISAPFALYDPITDTTLGQVFVYPISSLLNQDFTKFATLTGPIINNLGAGYGFSLAMDKDILAVGAYTLSKIQTPQ